MLCVVGSNPKSRPRKGPSVTYTPISRGPVPAGPGTLRPVERRKRWRYRDQRKRGNGPAKRHYGVASRLVAKGKGGGPSASYGTQSPREPDFAVDPVGWQNGMATPGGGGGTEVFAWLGDLAWPGDFIEASPPGTLPATPWINGDADFSNWGVNTAAIVLNNTDGWADGFSSSEPGATIAEYPTAELLCPSNPGDTVVTNMLNGNPTATTQNSDINYNASWTPDRPTISCCGW